VIISTPSFFAISTSSISDYWDDDLLPPWPRLRTIAYCPGQVGGYGAEPHYHDNDEFWFFTSGGRGEAWLDGERFEVGPNTIVYTPMGVVHRFQMFDRFGNVGIRTRLEGQRRAAHLHPPEDGDPVPTDGGLVVPGDVNDGPIVDPPARCPVREMRVVEIRPDEPVDLDGDTVVYVLAVLGKVEVEVGGSVVELAALQQSACSGYGTAATPQGDLLVARPGESLIVRSRALANIVLIRE
jgi:mannose-6-phosphate isomerase-like protein (cupin superfamily)